MLWLWVLKNNLLCRHVLRQHGWKIGPIRADFREGDEDGNFSPQNLTQNGPEDFARKVGQNNTKK